VLDFFGVYG
jgi:hypothetical protein